MGQLFKKHTDFVYLLTSVLVSQIGTWFSYMLMVVAIYNQSKDVLTTMILSGSSMIAGLLGGQIAGVYAENRQPKQLLITSDWISGVLIALVFFFPLNVWLYALISFFIALVNTYRQPAFEKYLVSNVDEEERMEANASYQTVNQAVQIVGPALAVFVLSLLPANLKKAGFLIDAFSYFSAALLLLRINQSKLMTATPSLTNSSKVSFFEKWKEGLTPLKDFLVLSVFIVFLFMIYGVSGADVMLTAHISDSQLSTYSIGYVLGSLSFGMIITSMFASRWVRKWPLKLQLGLSGFALGLFYMFLGIETSLITMMVAAFFMGVFNAIFNMSSSTFWQNRIDYGQLARFFGFVGSLVSTVQLVGMGMNGLVSEWLGAGYGIIICGGLIAASGFGLIVTVSIVKQKERTGSHVIGK